MWGHLPFSNQRGRELGKRASYLDCEAMHWPMDFEKHQLLLTNEFVVLLKHTTPPDPLRHFGDWI
jgi:hypothetical protein